MPSTVQTPAHLHTLGSRACGLILALALPLCGCGGGSAPATLAQTQSVAFATAPTLTVQGSANVSAHASSGLAVTYSSATPSVCSVDSNSGLVHDLGPGTCTIVATQSGNAGWVPAQATQSLPVATGSSAGNSQTVQFDPAPTLSWGGVATVSASASSGLAVSYSSLTPSLCQVEASTGLVSDLQPGNCVIAAQQLGNAQYLPAVQVTQNLTVSPATPASSPAAPLGVTATLGSSLDSVVIQARQVDSGNSPVTGYTVSSVPAGIVQTVTTNLPVLTIQCPTSCAGYAFALSASNALGTGAASAAAHVMARYQVSATFDEPDTQPNNTVFTGTFSFDFSSQTVSGLAGTLSESMTGPPMTLVSLQHQLASMPDSTGTGLLVSSFALSTTDTFVVANGNQGWLPGPAQYARYAGFPSALNPAYGGVGNAYVQIFVNRNDPSRPLSQSQIDQLAYADCTSGGMMGAVCMTGTSAAVYGSAGSMSGYPLAQSVLRLP